jgi:hypothetical protein
MIVLIAGMPRSGSTFSFNVAREVLRARGTTHQQSVEEDVIGPVCRSGGTSHVLVKAHNLDEPSLALARAGAMRIIMTVRRVEDALASWFTAFDAFPEDQSLQIMRNWLKLFAQLRAHSLIVPYEQTDRNPWFAAWRIARYLYPVGPAEAIAIARRSQKAEVKRRADELCVGAPGIVDAGFSHFDEQTFFHRRHVAALQSRPAEQVLSKEALARIRQTLASAGLRHEVRRSRAKNLSGEAQTISGSLKAPLLS